MNVVRSVMGKMLCRFNNGRKAIGCPAAFVVESGTGAPDKIKRGPIVPEGIALKAGQALVPGVGMLNGFEPVKPVLPPLDARNP